MYFCSVKKKLKTSNNLKILNKMKAINILLLTLFAGLMFFSCERHDCDNCNPDKQKPPLKIASDSSMVAQGNAFAMKLFSVTNAQNSDDENLVLSPLSLNMALAMVWNGANGNTKTAIQTAMGMDDYSPESVNEYFKTIREGFMQTDAANTQLAMANSIWYRPEFPVKQPFINLNLQYYNAQVEQLDFNLPNACDILNQWCSDNTNGLIDDMFSPPIASDLIMFLINALYFKSVWADSLAFDPEETYSANFYKTPTQQIYVQMMHQKNDFQYYCDENLQLLTIPYGNGAFTMNFVLPQDNKTFTEMLTTLNAPNYWNNCLNSRYLKPAFDVYIPKFKVRYDTEEKLIPILTELGMGIAFNEFAADFSGISNVPTFISMVKQKTYIDVNEQGTEAAAVTVIGSNVTSVQPVFMANRPFLFVIQEESTGVVLFMGKINNPIYE
jgi:serpin B